MVDDENEDEKKYTQYTQSGSLHEVNMSGRCRMYCAICKYLKRGTLDYLSKRSGSHSGVRLD